MAIYRYPLKAAFTESPDTIAAGNFVAFINQSTGSSSFYWTFGDGTNSYLPAPQHQYNIPGVYTVYLITADGNGCQDTATETVDVIEVPIYIPNVFTPNEDGVNDVFHVKAADMQTYVIHIYNRWGRQVFESSSPNIDWSGRSSSGVMEEDGTYYYLITATDYSGNKYNLKGFVQLIR